MNSDIVDVCLVGGGVMSATLGMLLKQLDPSLKIMMVEQCDQIAQESSDGWNNAGTGHAAYCELNYTPKGEDGAINIDRALQINSEFETSLQFWSYLVEQSALPAPGEFIRRTPHMSFVWGEEDCQFLKKRYESMSAHPLFGEMKFSDDPEQLKKWMPLVMKGRPAEQPVAATNVGHGADVDFGALTRKMVEGLQNDDNFRLLLQHKVRNLEFSDNLWHVDIANGKQKTSQSVQAKFVFLGAGGAALRLLQQSKIPEAKQYAGFPVSGRWLVCNNPAVVKQHMAKVYGQAPVGAPPMSVPHLDTRIIDGKPALLFGPFAGMTSKFLKNGSRLDLLESVKPYNVGFMINAGLDNLALTHYLIKEAFQPANARIETLRRFYPHAEASDWRYETAGQRVQIIKKTKTGGSLQFGTEVVTSQDGSLAALLGASPGASTSVQAMLQVIERCFTECTESLQWKQKLKVMIPSYGESIIDDPALASRVRQWTDSTLRLRKHTFTEVQKPIPCSTIDELVA
ncbi:MAG: malate dehydrogenase (quinone) [Oleiphilaceae bacterium]|jgi:malate dehydrogenase (quinone)